MSLHKDNFNSKRQEERKKEGNGTEHCKPEKNSSKSNKLMEIKR